MKGSEKKSKEQWEAEWKEALRIGICPIAGCSLLKRTCRHLDKYLAYDPYSNVPGKNVNREVNALHTGDIDDFSLRAEKVKPRTEGVLAFYWQLRPFGLSRDQVLILIRKFHVGMSNRQILIEMGWNSHDTLNRRYNEALEILKRNGWGE